jgi:hypothetical protein
MSSDRSIYLALAELSARHRAAGAGHAGAGDGRLDPFELRVFSQNGEDGVLAEILARIGVGERHFVEFGVETGVEANCVFLADVLGWSGLFLEGDAQLHAALERKYRGNDRVRTIAAVVTPENLESLLGAAGTPSEPDVMSIDVDGHDYWIWASLERYRPRVVVIEYNSALDPGRRLVQPADTDAGWDGTDFFGASLGALRDLADSKGYALVHTELCGVNAFFVRRDLAEGRFPAPELVSARGAPNYFHSGRGHPHHTGDARYLDLASGASVPASELAAPS